jgi:hypothetical protein
MISNTSKTVLPESSLTGHKDVTENLGIALEHLERT